MTRSPWQWIRSQRSILDYNGHKYGLLTIIALTPIACILVSIWGTIIGIDQLKKKIHSAHRTWKLRPHSLPKKRKRALTAPLLAPSLAGLLPFHRQKSIVQTESALCTKIPFEVRERIFEYVILGEGNVVHVFKDYRKFLMWRCRRQVGLQPCTWRRPCSVFLSCNSATPVRDESGVHRIGIRGWDDLEWGNEWGVLGLLRSCRQIYTETITQVYTKLHFHLPFPSDIPAFASTILPSRLNSIRTLSFDVERFDLDKKDANFLGKKEIAETLRQMRGLQDLRIYFKGCWSEDDFTGGTRGCVIKMDGDRKQMRDNFRGVKGLRRFEVVIDSRIVHQYLPFWEGFWEDGTEASLVISEEDVEEEDEIAVAE